MKLMKDLIRKLVEAWGPSGYEHQVRALIAEEVKGLADEMQVDPLGNLICRVGTPGGLKVMIAAHMDEIGVMVSHVDRQGFLRFSNIGGVFPATLHGNRVKFENGVIGTVGVEHAWTLRQRLPDLTDFYIDASSGLAGERDVNVGDPAIFWRPMEEHGNRVIAKSLDDRIGCVIAIETMRRLKAQNTPHEVYFVFTVQEEVGTRGAQPAAFGIMPDLGIAIDVTSTGDTPKGAAMAVEMGKGAAIKVVDTGHIVPPAIKNLMIRTAQENNIPYQLEVLTLGTTDAKPMQLTQSGVPCGAISIPTRHLHTTSESVDLGDVTACIDLLTAILTHPIENIRPQ